MPKAGKRQGFLRLRQVYSRAGHNYCAISMPAGLMDYLGWQPGTMLFYYPTKDGGMMLMPEEAAMKGFPNYDVESESAPDKLRRARPGSIAEREEIVDQELRNMEGELDEITRNLTKAQREEREAVDEKVRRSAKKKTRRRRS